jgi:phosphate transport system protein
MHRHFEEIEADIKDRILSMGSLAEEMIFLAIQGLSERRNEPLLKVAENEERVNLLHIDVDGRCLNLIALHQPAAADLRFIIAAIKINSDLERIADQAINVSQTARLLLDQPQLERKLLDIPRMAALAQCMLKDSLDAFVNKDVDLARRVLARDAEEDRLKSESFNELMHLMQGDSSTIERALGLILISRNLERIADHATNIAEDVVFMALGKDVRHGPRDQGGPTNLGPNATP